MSAPKPEKRVVALTTSALFTKTQDNLKLNWWAGEKNSEKGFTRLSFKSSELGLVGYFNLIHINQAQILGETELKFFEQADNATLKKCIIKVISKSISGNFYCG